MRAYQVPVSQSVNSAECRFRQNTAETVLGESQPAFTVMRVMVSHCANPSCGRPLSSLAEGRLFQFEITSISISAVDEKSAQFDETPHRETAHFWLCAQCASTMMLTLDPLEGLRVLPLESLPSVPRSLAPDRKPLHDC